MKPLVIVLQKEKEVSMSISDFNKYIEESYYQGFEDGKASIASCPTVTTYPSWKGGTAGLVTPLCTVNSNANISSNNNSPTTTVRASESVINAMRMSN
jgi:hypothetical protein